MAGVVRYAHENISGMKVTGVTNTFCLILRPARQEETCAWCRKSGQEPLPGELKVTLSYFV